MARSRMIKPEFFDDEKLSEISVRARLLFIALWVNSDDYGVVKGNAKWLKAQAFPYDEFKVSEIKKDLDSLVKIKCILPFSVHNESFFYIRNWNKYQKVNRPSQGIRNPEPPQGILNEYSMRDHGSIMFETETETETETEYIVEKNNSRLLPPYKKIIEYLNEKTNQKYKPETKSTRNLIKARWNEGFTEQDFYKVIDNKTSEWLTDEKMVKFLRPQTLFQASKFESYLQEPQNGYNNEVVL